ncbi:MAG TPA: MoxR family ATPase [Acidobacteriota bacterium]|nr:MoxR family ATPase [Acidobacteriota bacterium]
MKEQHPRSIAQGLESQGYVADEELATVIFLLLRLGRPLLIEGHAGVGKTEVANALAGWLGCELIRLQCYEGLDVHSAVYEWNYQKQLLAIQLQKGSDSSLEEKEAHVFGRQFLLERPLLRSITAQDGPPVLLIDEIDRADEEFEAFLLELLSAFQISIPELGTIHARHKPHVILTSNRTRDLSDALKRRCLYCWIEYPSLDKELAIVRKRLPGIDRQLAAQVVKVVQALRRKKLSRSPGVAETLDWAMALTALGKEQIDSQSLRQTIGCLIKSQQDLDALNAEELKEVLTLADS